MCDDHWPNRGIARLSHILVLVGVPLVVGCGPSGIGAASQDGDDDRHAWDFTIEPVLGAKRPSARLLRRPCVAGNECGTYRPASGLVLILRAGDAQLAATTRADGIAIFELPDDFVAEVGQAQLRTAVIGTKRLQLSLRLDLTTFPSVRQAVQRASHDVNEHRQRVWARQEERAKEAARVAAERARVQQERVARCQAAADTGDLLRAKLCWTEKAWKAAQGGSSEQARETVECLVRAETAWQTYRSCIKAPERTDAEVLSKLECLERTRLEIPESCPPLTLTVARQPWASSPEGRVFEKRLADARRRQICADALTRAEGAQKAGSWPLFAKAARVVDESCRGGRATKRVARVRRVLGRLCTKAVAQARRAFRGDDMFASVRWLDEASEYCSAKRRRELAALERRVAARRKICGSGSMLGVVMGIRTGRVDERRMRGCVYNNLGAALVVNTGPDGWTVVTFTGSVALVKARRPLADGSRLPGGRARYVGLRSYITVQRARATVPAFRLLR